MLASALFLATAYPFRWAVVLYVLGGVVAGVTEFFEIQEAVAIGVETREKPRTDALRGFFGGNLVVVVDVEAPKRIGQVACRGDNRRDENSKRAADLH